jgi:IclR family transcriptional regulator, acetate operon repressor
MRHAVSRPATPVAGGTGTQAIGRTLAVLELFRERGADLGISEIAERLSLSASTVHRIVRALVDEGYLAQNEQTDRYYLGRSAVLLGQAANERLGLHRAQLVLERIREETGESVNLGVRDGNEMLVVIRAESKHALRFSQEPGSRLPVYATAMGKAYLSHGSLSIEQEVAALDRPLRALTTRTLTSAPKLREELTRIRRRGYSIDDEEALAGVRCVAAPILSPNGEMLAAVAIQAPAVRMPRTRLKQLSGVIRQAADEIAQVMPGSHHL